MKPFSLEEYLANPSKKVITRDGRNVTIHCINLHGLTPIIAEIEGEKYSIAFCKDGRAFEDKDTSCDLVFAPEKHEGWVNVFAYADGTRDIETRIFESKEDAERKGREWDGYKVTIKVEWEEE